MMEPRILTTTSTIIEEKHISPIPTPNRLDSHSFFVVLYGVNLLFFINAVRAKTV
jgi:hypothetical protein